jgi:hypothetical protein
LANKKTGGTTPGVAVYLSKQDKELVDAQLRKEAEIRRRVDDALFRLSRGLALVRSIVVGNPNEFALHYLLEVVEHILKCAAEQAAVVVSDEFYMTFNVSSICELPVLHLSEISIFLA